MPRKIITILTDFGTKDNYVAIMKGVMLNICEDVLFVDISHDVSKFNILEGAFLLSTSFNYFPKDTVHLVVIDPGVGTSRKPIAILTRNYIFVGPDNGVLLPAAESDGIIEARLIENSDFFLKGGASYTFHGRDIFAPIAAYIACNKKFFSKVGRTVPLEELVKPPICHPKADKGRIEGSVFHIDSFGNIITNIPSTLLGNLNELYGKKLTVKINKKTLKLPFVQSFGYVTEGSFLALIDSYGLFEISLNKGNAAKKLNVNTGNSVTIFF